MQQLLSIGSEALASPETDEAKASLPNSTALGVRRNSNNSLVQYSLVNQDRMNSIVNCDIAINKGINAPVTQPLK